MFSRKSIEFMVTPFGHTGGFFQTNAWFLPDPDDGGGILVDAPEETMDWLEKKALRPSALLLTHCHIDHVGNAAVIQNRFRCPVYAFIAPDRDLTLENLLAAGGTEFAIEPYSVDQLVAHGDTIRIGDIRFEARHVPGHSTDSLVFVSEDREILFSGDTLMAGTIGRSDFPGGDHEMLISGIREHLLNLPSECAVYPGHGPATTVGNELAGNPFV